MQKVRFILAWQTYRVGDVIEPNGTLRSWLLGNGYVELVNSEAESPARPARLGARAAKKIADTTKGLFGGSKS